MNNMTSSILLARAANELEKSGLCKNDFGGATGPTDVLGAIFRAKYAYVAKKRGTIYQPITTSSDSRFQNAIVKGAVNKINRVLKISVPSYADAIVAVSEWNDQPSRRKGQVVKVLRQAAKLSN